MRATEGYTAALPGLERALLPLSSSMIVTEPLDADTWAQIGWEGCETLDDAAHAYIYAQRTADGRIAIGGRGRPYRFGSSTDRAGEIPDATVRQLRARLVRLFPVLRDVRLDGAWTGVFGVARDWAAAVHCDRDSGLCWAGGYAGEGVAAANLAAPHAARPHPRPRHRARAAAVGRPPGPRLGARAAALAGGPDGLRALPHGGRDRGPHGEAVAGGGGGGSFGRALTVVVRVALGGAARRQQHHRGKGGCGSGRASSSSVARVSGGRKRACFATVFGDA